MNSRSVRLLSFTFLLFVAAISLALDLVHSQAPQSRLNLVATNRVAINRLTINDEKISHEDNGRQIILKAGSRPILKYNYAEIQPPKGIASLYARSGHIHPIYTPNGVMVTDDFSDDHAHQHGLFYAFVKAEYDGQVLDFWNQHKKTANVKSIGHTIKAESNRLFLETKQAHYRLSDDKTIFEEVWTIECSSTKDLLVTDWQINIKNVTQSEITVQKNHYGSFGIRGAREWRDTERSGFTFLTASGKNRSNGNLAREKWVVMQGKIGKQNAGVIVLSHSDNFRFPQPVRLHPTMPYFSFAPMATKPFVMKPGDSLVSRFRLVTFDGSLDVKKIKTLALD